MTEASSRLVVSCSLTTQGLSTTLLTIWSVIIPYTRERDHSQARVVLSPAESLPAVSTSVSARDTLPLSVWETSVTLLTLSLATVSSLHRAISQSLSSIEKCYSPSILTREDKEKRSYRGSLTL